jgi:hypothetical protein
VCLFCQAVSWQKERLEVASFDPVVGDATMVIYVKCFSGDVHDLQVHEHMTISELKALIETSAGIPAEEQHLYFEEHSQLQLEGPMTLPNCSIKNGTRIH